jgi:hypothetical protein
MISGPAEYDGKSDGFVQRRRSTKAGYACEHNAL